MITVQEALHILSDSTIEFGIAEISLNEGMGRVLREKIIADRDFPPYDRVTMDGIAINYESFEKGERKFTIEGIAAAGAPKMQLSNKQHCLEVMTGAIMPDVADTVIRYEDITIVDGVATINIEKVRHRQNVHFKGSDRSAGELIIAEGKVLSSSEIGVCATVGKSTVKVSKLPKTLIISTGDELVDIDQDPLPHQIRKSNVYRLQTTLKSYGITVETAHLNDDYDQIIEALKEYLIIYDLILLSGGVSKGKFDYLPQALEELGVKKLFHKIQQRPGKPFWFGKNDNAVVFAMPGNPVSSFLCTHRYFKPWLDTCLGISEVNQPYAELTDDVIFKPDLTYYPEIKLSIDQSAKVLATPVQGNGSGDLANLVEGDAFIELPQGKDTFKKGEIYPVYIYR